MSEVQELSVQKGSQSPMPTGGLEISPPGHTMPTRMKKNPAASMPHAALRFQHPSMSSTQVPDARKINQTEFLHIPGEQVYAPVPLIVKHGIEQTKGIIEGDHHTKNTNPGFIRNPLGGFYTS